jgi:hypothetical protein
VSVQVLCICKWIELGRIAYIHWLQEGKSHVRRLQWNNCVYVDYSGTKCICMQVASKLNNVQSYLGSNRSVQDVE